MNYKKSFSYSDLNLCKAMNNFINSVNLRCNPTNLLYFYFFVTFNRF